MIYLMCIKTLLCCDTPTHRPRHTRRLKDTLNNKCMISIFLEYIEFDVSLLVLNIISLSSQ